MKPLVVSFTARATRKADEAATWWVQNRTKAPTAFREELERALALISVEPGVGVPARNPRFADVRRVFLHRVRYHLYYRVIEKDSPEIQVLAMWHESRRTGPRL